MGKAATGNEVAGCARDELAGEARALLHRHLRSGEAVEVQSERRRTLRNQLKEVPGDYSGHRPRHPPASGGCRCRDGGLNRATP